LLVKSFPKPQYKIVGIDIDCNEPDTVQGKFACPKCHNNQVDKLEIDSDEDIVRCLNCGISYRI
jgi:transcription elongation factor Elf1